MAQQTRRTGGFDPYSVLRRAAENVQFRVCDYPGCKESGEFRAPKDRRLADYYWFCLEHVRAYNKSWNYYAGMTEPEIEDGIKRATIWERPSWPLGGTPSGLYRHEKIRDTFGLFEEAADNDPDLRSRKPKTREEDAALEVMGLTWPLTAGELKARYKELVKRYHPDKNNGDKSSEERFKIVSEAYRILINTCDIPE